MEHAKGTILIVDDDRDIADLVQEILQEEGYTVSVLYELGSEALHAAVEQIKPDCILLDGGTGASYGSSWEDAEWLETRLRTMAVIMFTAHGEAIREAEEQESPRSQAAHFFSILPKPFELEELLSQVRQATSKVTAPEGEQRGSV
jgi:DNA-binding response OmpR family regulator